jgi:hypothetical protein
MRNSSSKCRFVIPFTATTQKKPRIERLIFILVLTIYVSAIQIYGDGFGFAAIPSSGFGREKNSFLGGFMGFHVAM